MLDRFFVCLFFISSIMFVGVILFDIVLRHATTRLLFSLSFSPPLSFGCFNALFILLMGVKVFLPSSLALAMFGRVDWEALVNDLYE